MLDRRHLVAILDDDVGFFESRLDLAEAELLVIVFTVIFEGVLGIRCVDRGRTRLQRLLDVEHRW